MHFLTAFLYSRWQIATAEHDETGASTVEWMMLSVVALVVMALLIVAMPALTQSVLDFIKDGLGV